MPWKGEIWQETIDAIPQRCARYRRNIATSEGVFGCYTSEPAMGSGLDLCGGLDRVCIRGVCLMIKNVDLLKFLKVSTNRRIVQFLFEKMYIFTQQCLLLTVLPLILS